MCFHARKLYGWGLEMYAKRRLFVGGGGGLTFLGALMRLLLQREGERREEKMKIY